jgi:hypothetical protein
MAGFHGFINRNLADKTMASAVALFHKVNPIDVKDKLHKSEPPQTTNRARQVADSYAQKNNLKLTHGLPQVKVNPEFAKKVANHFDTMPHTPNDPKVKEAYGALINETSNQFQHIMDSGLKISKIKPGQANPYKNSKEVHDDINNNNHLWYFPTESGFGSEGSQNNDHPLMTKTNFHHEGPLLANDLFRIVHDYFGHAKDGYSFGPNGEEAAFRAHKQMYSPLAQKALASETRMQNSWVNFGPHSENNKKNPDKTIYADQKANIAPDWAIKDY